MHIPASALCIDIEASGLGHSGFPIEIAIASTNGWSRSWLINPAEAWLAQGGWSDEAERIHGIPLSNLLSGGLPPEAFALELEALCSGRNVLSDAPEFDQRWLDKFFEAASRRNPIQLGHVLEFAETLLANQKDRQRLIEECADSAGLFRAPVHRAEPDAKALADFLAHALEKNRPMRSLSKPTP